MRGGKGPGSLAKKKHFKKKKRGPGALATVDEEAPLDDGTVLSEEAPFWRCRGFLGILGLSVMAGFCLTTLVLQQWRSLSWEPGASEAAELSSPGEPPPPPAAAPEPALPAASIEASVAALPAVMPPVQVVMPVSSERRPGHFDQPRVLWIHLHSYGGTTMCDLARAHGEKVSPPKDNCNIMPDACSTPKTFRVPCKKRAASLQYTFSAVERVLDEDDLSCSKGSAQTMLFGIMLRDPVAAMKSTMIGNGFEKKPMLQTLRSRIAPRNLAFHFCLPPFDTFQHFDNFATRSLSGDYDVPVGEVTRQHLEKAKGVLSKMDVVLIMEELSDHLAQLRAVFGWQMDLDRGVWRSHWHQIPRNVFSDEEVKFLKKMNSLDYELFEFAQTVARQLTAQAKQRLSQ